MLTMHEALGSILSALKSLLSQETLIPWELLKKSPITVVIKLQLKHAFQMRVTVWSNFKQKFGSSKCLLLQHDKIIMKKMFLDK